MGDYRKLEVYKLACGFSDRVAILTQRLSRRLPDNADQLRRAADSVHRAIAEGCGLNSDAQLLKFLKVALGSANESENELHALNRRGELGDEDLDLLEVARRLCAMIARFISRVENDIARSQDQPRRRREQFRKELRSSRAIQASDGNRQQATAEPPPSSG